jgi:assimilatory nitrate reductase catalytic subunit
VGGLSRSTAACCARRGEALPAGLASRSADDGAAARHVVAVRLQPLPYDEAIARVAARSRASSSARAGAIAVLGGASLTTEKTYLLGKFARVCLKTPFIDYNGRLCMVSAGRANKKAFGIDRTTNPWSDMVGTDVIWVAGSNVAECSPITTNYIWQAREQGAKVIVQDPRITPVARTCDLYLPVKPGATRRCSPACCRS